MSVAVIPLGRKGLVTIIDEADYELVKDYSWNVSGKSKFYARTSLPGFKTLSLHHLLMNPPQGLIVDHINGSTLDNRRSNLRLCTLQQNSRNAIMKKNNMIGFKGVCYHSRMEGKKPYQARCHDGNGKRVSLGYYKTAEEAAIAYANFAIPLHGEFFNNGSQYV